MITLESITPGLALEGVEPTEVVTVVAVVPIAEGTITLIYKNQAGTLKDRLLTRNDAANTPSPKAYSFHGSFDVKAATAKARLRDLADDIITVLATDSNAQLKISLEIDAQFSQGVQDHTKRAVSENANNLGFKNADWE